MEAQYRFYLWQSCVYQLQKTVISVTSFGTPDGGRLEFNVDNASGFATAGGQLIAYEEGIDGENIVKYATTLSADHGVNSIQVQEYYDATPVRVINWVALQQRTAVDVYDFLAGKYVWDRSDVQYMRKTYDGKLLLKNAGAQADYDIIQIALGNDCCCSFVLDIERFCSGVWELDFQGIFNAVDCIINVERCQVQFEVQPYDRYRCLLESGEPDINVLEVADTTSVNIDYTNSFEFQTCTGTIVSWAYGFQNFGGCTVPDPDAATAGGGYQVDIGCLTDVTEGWLAYETVYTIVSTSPALVEVTQTWFREQRITLDVAGVPNPPPGSGWVNVAAHVPIFGNPSTKWVRRPYDGYYDTYNAATIDYPCTGTVRTKIAIPGTTITYDRCRTLADVLDFVAKQTCAQISGIRSDFFAINPVGDSPDYVPGENYVTQATNELNDLLVLQKSDFLTPNSSNQATKGIITWKQLITDICTIFNMGWYIDFDGYIRIEHLKYFEAFQLQNQIDVTGEKANEGQRKYEYDSTDLPQKETWRWQDEVSDDFNGYPITYNANCTDDNTAKKDYQIQHFTTDVDFMQAAPDSVSKDGFVLIARSGTDAIQSTSPVSLVVMNNGPLAEVALQPAYYTWGRVLPNGIMNDVPTAFDSSLHLRKTKDLILKGCCKTYTFDNSYVLGEAGNCLIQKVEFDLKRNIYTFNLKTDANC